MSWPLWGRTLPEAGASGLGCRCWLYFPNCSAPAWRHANQFLRRSKQRSRTAFKALRVGLAAGFVFAAGARAVGLVYRNIVVAGGANHSVNSFGKLLMAGFRCVF